MSDEYDLYIGVPHVSHQEGMLRLWIGRVRGERAACAAVCDPARAGRSELRPGHLLLAYEADGAQRLTTFAVYLPGRGESMRRCESGLQRASEWMGEWFKKPTEGHPTWVESMSRKIEDDPWKWWQSQHSVPHLITVAEQGMLPPLMLTKAVIACCSGHAPLATNVVMAVVREMVSDPSPERQRVIGNVLAVVSNCKPHHSANQKVWAEYYVAEAVMAVAKGSIGDRYNSLNSDAAWMLSSANNRDQLLHFSISTIKDAMRIQEFLLGLWLRHAHEVNVGNGSYDWPFRVSCGVRNRKVLAK